MLIANLETHPNLIALRAEALALIPARHLDGDVAYVEITETLRHDSSTHACTPRQLAQIVTQSLDNAQ